MTSPAESARVSLPSPTLFCFNLNTKIALRDLKACLFEFFCPYGKTIDIVAAKADPKKRGNAFVVFADIPSATNALRNLQGKVFLGRNLGIQYAKTKSDKIAILDGSYKIRRKPGISKAKRSSALEEQPQDIYDASALSLSAALTPSSSVATLFVENLPDIMTQAALTILFKQYPGFREARLVPQRHVAFVDYNNDVQAEMARKGLDGFLVTPEAALSISVAKTDAV